MPVMRTRGNASPEAEDFIKNATLTSGCFRPSMDGEKQGGHLPLRPAGVTLLVNKLHVHEGREDEGAERDERPADQVEDKAEVRHRQTDDHLQ